MEQFESQFLSDEPGANKVAVKNLTKAITLEFRKMTVNCPDWYVPCFIRNVAGIDCQN